MNQNRRKHLYNSNGCCDVNKKNADCLYYRYKKFKQRKNYSTDTEMWNGKNIILIGSENGVPLYDAVAVCKM